MKRPLHNFLIKNHSELSKSLSKTTHLQLIKLVEETDKQNNAYHKTLLIIIEILSKSSHKDDLLKAISAAVSTLTLHRAMTQDQTNKVLGIGKEEG